MRQYVIVAASIFVLLLLQLRNTLQLVPSEVTPITLLPTGELPKWRSISVVVRDISSVSRSLFPHSTTPAQLVKREELLLHMYQEEVQNVLLRWHKCIRCSLPATWAVVEGVSEAVVGVFGVDDSGVTTPLLLRERFLVGDGGEPSSSLFAWYWAPPPSFDTMDLASKRNALLPSQLELSTCVSIDVSVGSRDSLQQKGEWLLTPPSMARVTTTCPETYTSRPTPTQHDDSMDVIIVVTDSVSRDSFRRRAPLLNRWLASMQESNSTASNRSVSFSFEEFGVVGCCTPSNLVALLSGAVGSESDACIAREPAAASQKWIWNTFRAASNSSRVTFFGTDVCPDRTSRDFLANPNADVAFVGPTCMLGTTLSRFTVDSLRDGTVMLDHLMRSFERFWLQSSNSRRFALLYIAGTHEPSENVLHVADRIVHHSLQQLQRKSELDRAVLLVSSDHGIGFGDHVATRAGWKEQLQPFAKLVLPTSVAFVAAPASLSQEIHSPCENTWSARLTCNSRRSVTAFDLNVMLRALILHGSAPHGNAAHAVLPFHYSNATGVCGGPPPNIPLNPLWQHIPERRSCSASNIPAEWCRASRILWISANTSLGRYVTDRLRSVHLGVLGAMPVAQRKQLCHVVTSFSPLFLAVRIIPAYSASRAVGPGRVVVTASYRTLPGNNTFRLTLRATRGVRVRIIRLLNMEKKSGTNATTIAPPPGGKLEVVRLLRTSLLGDGCGGRVAGLRKHICECRGAI